MSVALVFRVLFYVLSLFCVIYSAWLGVLSIIGLLSKRKSYPYAEEGTFAVMICARNEEMVIGQLIDSLHKQNYSSDKFKVFVVAHNCTDDTAKIATEHGATVFVRNAPEEKRKTCALQYGLECVNEQYGEFFDYYAVFDADAIVSRDFLKEMNAGLATGADIAAGYYDSKNFNDSIVSKVTGTMYHIIMHCNSMAHNTLHLPVNVYGSGYAVRMKWGQKIAELATNTGDFEFSTTRAMMVAKSIEVPNAVFYAEMPVTWKEAFSQRRRWAMGNTQCVRKYHWKMFKCIPKLGIGGLKQYIDLTMNPFMIISVIGMICGVIAMAIEGITLTSVIALAAGGIFIYMVFALSSLITLKLQKVKLSQNILTILIEPLWVAVTMVYAVETFFRRDVEWKQTKRVASTSLEDIENK